MKNELQFTTIKVSDKGQIAIPSHIRNIVGIRKGDKLLLARKGKKILLQKPDKLVRQLNDDFKDIDAISERSLRRLWDNKEDDIWDKYIEHT